MAEKDEIQKRIKEEIARLDKASAKSYQDQLKGLDAINASLDTYQSLLNNIKNDVADMATVVRTDNEPIALVEVVQRLPLVARPLELMSAMGGTVDHKTVVLDQLTELVAIEPVVAVLVLVDTVCLRYWM